MTSDPFKIRLHSRQFPASFTAFDILYYKDAFVTDQPLMERKKLLSKAVKENDRLSISRYIETNGIELFALTKERGLEGIVAKRKDSRYACGKRTKDWIKCKNLLDDDFIVCGYIVKEKELSLLFWHSMMNKTVSCIRGMLRWGPPCHISWSIVKKQIPACSPLSLPGMKKLYGSHRRLWER